VGLINIGGHFGMEPMMAAKAASAAKVKMAIPMHYGTFPVLTQDPKSFADTVRRYGIRYVGMQPGETLHFSGKQLVTKPGWGPGGGGVPPPRRHETHSFTAPAARCARADRTFDCRATRGGHI
jgi:hypothetical protein